MDINLSIQPADSQQFSMALSGLTGQLFEAAAANVDAATAGEQYTEIERRAMIAAEALRLVGGMDLASVLMRGEILQKIEREGLISVHPNGYADLTALAGEQGISVSELSDIRGLCNVIFPYIVNDLGRNLAEVWAEIGKAAFRELRPALQSIITRQNADHNSVRTAVATLLDTAAIDLRGQGIIDEETDAEEADALIRRQAVQSLLHSGATLPTRELRRAIRPSRTNPVETVTLQAGDEQWYAVVQIHGQDQYDMFNRLMGDHQNNMVMDGREDTRRIDALRRMFPGD